MLNKYRYSVKCPTLPYLIPAQKKKYTDWIARVTNDEWKVILRMTVCRPRPLTWSLFAQSEAQLDDAEKRIWSTDEDEYVLTPAPQATSSATAAPTPTVTTARVTAPLNTQNWENRLPLEVKAMTIAEMRENQHVSEPYVQNANIDGLTISDFLLFSNGYVKVNIIEQTVVKKIIDDIKKEGRRARLPSEFCSRVSLNSV